MPVAFIPRALLHPETQQPMAFPAIDMRSNERVDDATAYRPAALDQLEILRPHRALQRALAYLAHPDTAALSPAELREGLRTFTEDVLMGDVYKDPVLAADGETFSFEWLCDWAQAEQERAWADGRPFELISPFNRKVLTNDRLIPDIAMRALMAQLGVEVDHGAEHSYELPKASLPQDASWPALGEVTSNIWATFEGTDIQVRGVVRTEIREENIQVRGGVRGEIRRESWVPEDIVIMQNVSA